MEKKFDDKEYALSVWTSDKIQRLEERWLQQKRGWYELIASLLPNENEQALDVGCGIGMYYPLLTEKSTHYVGLDPTDAMVKRAQERHPEGDFRIGSVYKISFPNDWVDLVFCWSVLIHLPHDTIERALTELWRVTKRYLFFNLYIALDEKGFSTRGPWDEYLTAMDKWEVSTIIRKLNPHGIRRHEYEPVDLLDGKRFQRTIFTLEKNPS